ncbi:MAG: type II secretion system F family protein [Proteobacteria bacterium]|jgi:type IV pilus assembly protein PilC|nr:type II secretion system F family protein [Pseudomonadota bacterium]
MAEFLYEAKNQTGKTASGVIVADSKDAAESKLRQQGFSPTSLKKKPIEIHLSFQHSASSKDLKTFTQQFATMIDAGLPLVQCLEILGTQCDNKWFGARILEIKAIVEGGSTFSEALAKYPRIFDELFVNLVAAGELGGILDTIMKRLAEYIENRDRLMRKIKAAMVYPVGMLILMVCILFVMMKWVIPTFEKMFADFGDQELPAATQFFINLSRSFQTSWYIWIIVIVALVIGVKLFKRSKFGSYFLDRLYIRIPIVGPLVRKIAVARFTRTLGTLLGSGVPIMDALLTVAKASGNAVIERAVLFARDRISEGRNMSEPLQDSKVFPGMVIQMIAVGEQTGQLDVMCNKIAEFYDEEVEVAVGGLTSLLEPLMLVLIGVVAGGMVIAMYLPIFSLAGTIE